MPHSYAFDENFIYAEKEDGEVKSLNWEDQHGKFILATAKGYQGPYKIILIPGQNSDDPHQLFIRTPRVSQESIVQEIDPRSPCFDAVVGRLKLLCQEQDTWLRTHGATSKLIPKELDF